MKPYLYPLFVVVFGAAFRKTARWDKETTRAVVGSHFPGDRGPRALVVAGPGLAGTDCRCISTSLFNDLRDVDRLPAALS